MRFRSNKVKETTNSQYPAENKAIVEKKMDELISMLSQSEFDRETINNFQQSFNKAIENRRSETNLIKAFKIIDRKDDASRDELIDEFSMLLLSNKIDSNIARTYLKGERANRMVLRLVAFTIITLGFAMIIMPAPPYFEMFTIYYFSRNDGVTLMDLISLAVVFTGVYLFVRTFYKKTTRRGNYD